LRGKKFLAGRAQWSRNLVGGSLRKLARTTKGPVLKIMDNAYHLCNLISLLGPEEFKSR